MNVRIAALSIAVLGASVSSTAGAQSSGFFVARGISAYRALEYDSAAALFRRALTPARPDSLTGRSRADAYAYLGATEQLRGNGTAAAEAYVLSVASDPRYRMDDLIFPPDVTRVFEEARRSTAYVSVRVATDTLITAGAQSLHVRLYTSAPHDLVASLVRPGGDVVRQLHAGAAGDSVDITWNGLDAANERPLTGQLALQIRPAARVAYSTQTRMSVNVTALPVDTVVHPSRPATLPASTTPRGVVVSPVQSLVLGAVAGAAAIFLPDVVGKPASPMGARYAVGASLGAAGIAGFLLARRDERRETESVASAQAFDAWRERAATVRAENERRLRAPRLRIEVKPDPARSGGAR